MEKDGTFFLSPFSFCPGEDGLFAKDRFWNRHLFNLEHSAAVTFCFFWKSLAEKVADSD